MTILAMVNADKEGQIESKMMKARQMEEIREARKKEAEARQEERRIKLVSLLYVSVAKCAHDSRRTRRTRCVGNESGEQIRQSNRRLLQPHRNPSRLIGNEFRLLDKKAKWAWPCHGYGVLAISMSNVVPVSATCGTSDRNVDLRHPGWYQVPQMNRDYCRRAFD